jgi:hypothetical protein
MTAREVLEAGAGTWWQLLPAPSVRVPLSATAVYINEAHAGTIIEAISRVTSTFVAHGVTRVSPVEARQLATLLDHISTMPDEHFASVLCIQVARWLRSETSGGAYLQRHRFI